MPELAMREHDYLSEPFSASKLNKSALVEVAVFHLAIAALLLHSWTPAAQMEPAVKTVNIQMFELPKQKKVIEEKVIEKTPPPIEPEPVIKPEPPVKKAVVENDLAFKRVEKPVKKVMPKKPVQKKVEKVIKPIEKKPEKPVSKPLTQEKSIKPPTNKPVVATNKSTNSPQKTQISTNKVETDTFSVEHYKPIEKQAPDYPRGALRKGLEGDCTVRYTVNTQGQVESPEVMNDCHPLFKRPSLAAAKTFRYTPRMVNGKAVKLPDVRNTFEYRIH